MKHPFDLALYLVTNRGTLSHEDFFRIIRQSIEGGVKVVQLREKDASVREMIAIGKSLRTLLNPLGIPLIINDRADIAHAVNADGVHLGQSDLKIAEARAILGPQAIIGLSVGTDEQVIAAEDEDVTYLSAGPVFFTKTKPDCGKPCEFDGLTHLCSISRHPIIAIGGIDETNVGRVLECGAVGVAVVSAIFNAPCPKTAALTIINRMKKKIISRLM
jgi:thiamine-phosphate pyrophosphorylase